MDFGAEDISFAEGAGVAGASRAGQTGELRREWSPEELSRWERRIDHHLARPGVRVQRAAKRALDLVGCLGLALVLGPLLVGAAVAVRLSSPGPVLFRGSRWGWRGGTFACCKFRSMRRAEEVRRIETEAQRLEREASERAGGVHKTRNDPRVTRVGAWLRRTSIDELPQLWNVWRGEMSLVGPRPLVLPMMADHPEIRGVRGRMRPGMSGLWQVRARQNNTSVMDMLPHDLEYLARYSLWLDLKILWATFPAVLGGHGAI